MACKNVRFALAFVASCAYVGRVKTLTTREFFHSPGLVKSLRPGQSLVVTDNGKPAMTVTKAGKRPRKTMADLEREAREICPDDRGKLDLVGAIREMRN